MTRTHAEGQAVSSIRGPATGGWHDTLMLLLASLVVLAVWALTGNGYGFHRDELQFLDDARHLGAGFVAYPPLTSLAARSSIALFGISPMALRLPSALLNMATLVSAGLLARTLGGSRAAQLLTVALLLPVALAFGSVLQYNTPDLLAWTLLTLATALVLRSGNPRWWLLAGFAVGLGVESKYAIAFPTVSLLVALAALPSQRHHLRSRWFWLGALIALAVAAPNLLWLAHHHLVTVRMEQHIHARDVRLGRARGYYTDQLKYTLFALPFAVAGFVWLVSSRPFRILAVFWLGPFLLLALAQGRGYYLLPGYVPLYAAGAVVFTRWLAGQRAPLASPGLSKSGRTSCENPSHHRRSAVAYLAGLALALDLAAIAWAYLPVWPAGSAPWRWQMANNADMANEVGWPEFVAEVARVRDSLTPAERASYAVLADNYGEAGALALYGPAHGLPTPISPANSFWYRGYGAPANAPGPETVIITGSSLADEHNFHDCRVAARTTLPHGVRNEETDDEPEILVCHHLLLPWPEAWSHNQRFG